MIAANAWQRVVLALLATSLFCGCGDGKSAAPTVPISPVESSESNNATTKRDAAGAPAEFRDPHDVLAAGRFKVDIMELAFPERAAELATRMQDAASKNPDWWLEFVQNAEPGMPLPYDSRLGMTEDEYSEFLDLSEQVTARKKGEAILEIVSKGEQAFVLDGGESLPELTEIEFDLARDNVRTPFGVASQRSEVNATEESALGAWSGIEWKLDELAPDGIKGATVTVSIGNLKPSGRALLYYDVKKLTPEGKVRISCILNYDVPIKREVDSENSPQ